MTSLLWIHAVASRHGGQKRPRSWKGHDHGHGQSKRRKRDFDGKSVFGILLSDDMDKVLLVKGTQRYNFRCMFSGGYIADTDTSASGALGRKLLEQLGVDTFPRVTDVVKFTSENTWSGYRDGPAPLPDHVIIFVMKTDHENLRDLIESENSHGLQKWKLLDYTFASVKDIQSEKEVIAGLYPASYTQQLRDPKLAEKARRPTRLIKNRGDGPKGKPAGSDDRVAWFNAAYEKYAAMDISEFTTEYSWMSGKGWNTFKGRRTEPRPTGHRVHKPWLSSSSGSWSE